LIELILFILIVSVSVVGVLAALDRTARASAEPLVIKQALAVAEALLEEVELMPFTFCDPDDAQASTAQSATIGATGCAATIEALGPEGETRYGLTGALKPFDNVNDYKDYDSTADGGIKDITNTLIPGLASYTAAIKIVTTALAASPSGSIAALDGNGQANVLLITVTVTGPGNTTVVLNGYRTKYAPRI
jgi:MSHA pilin protein MshD